jgi:enoyl-CoA hydratase/carnithine racemase
MACQSRIQGDVMSVYTNDVLHEQKNGVGFITLNRPKALNALSLEMVREITHALLMWQDDPQVKAVVIRGSNKEGAFGSFCAGGDIRYFHRAALAGDPSLEDFFTEEYNLNHLIQKYPKPYIAFMDGIVMGGGMGLSQGAALRVVTERTNMAMPETHIGLFPDVGGGYFLSRCNGAMGEYLALTGQQLRGGESLHVGLADVMAAADTLPAVWDTLGTRAWRDGAEVLQWLREATHSSTTEAFQTKPAWMNASIDEVFALPTVNDMENALLQRSADAQHADQAWAEKTLKALHHQSPLMLHVSLEQVRRGRQMDLASELRMERDMVRHCFYTQHLNRSGVSSETVEGIRALAVDKDHQPKWNPASIAEVTTEMVQPFFNSPWPAAQHPLRHLKD